MRKLSLFLAAAALLLHAPPARADIFALVVGVDAYETLPSLNGATNDAKDLAATLALLGADVELLLDGAATRQAVVDAFRRQAGRAGPGDMFVFTYAGHGVQEPQAIPGDEADGLDETIVFSGFAWNTAGAGERLRDNEIGELLTGLHPEARGLVVVDSCHSGTMTRSADPRGRPAVTRFGGIGRISEDPLPPPASTAGRDMSGARNVVFVAAARDTEQIPEVDISGAMRGAVSWSVARALAGADDFGGPAMPLAQFQTYVRAQARALSGARQTPSVTAGDGVGLDAAVIPASAGATAMRLPAAPLDDRPPAVFVASGRAKGGLGEDGDFVADRAAADLIWDLDVGEVVDRAGADMIAEAWTVAELQPVLRKWRASRSLKTWALRRHVEMRISPDDGRHRLGETIGISVARPTGAAAYLTVVNLASTGEVQFVFPSVRGRDVDADRIPPGEGMEFLGEVKVVRPIGADHVIAIYAPERPAALHAWLEAGKPTAEALIARLRANAAGDRYSVGVAPIYTTP